MPLQGTFDVLDFTAVMELLAAREMTGRLHVRSRSFGANLFFEDGRLIGADQSEHQAAAVSGDVSGRLEEICFELLELDRGNFEFHPGRSIELPMVNSLSVQEVVAQARKRLEEWHELQRVIPSLEMQPRLVHEIDTGAVTLDRERWRVLTAVDGRRNVRAIGRALNLSDYDACRYLRDLLQAGVIELDERSSVLAAGMAGGTIDLEGSTPTEQITINGKRATRIRTLASGTPTGVGAEGQAVDQDQEQPTAPPGPKPAVSLMREPSEALGAPLVEQRSIHGRMRRARRLVGILGTEADSGLQEPEQPEPPGASES